MRRVSRRDDPQHLASIVAPRLARVIRCTAGESSAPGLANARLYLPASEMAAAEQKMMGDADQMTERKGAVQITRDYIGAEEARLRAVE
jgi:hypothetical protein